MNTRLQTITEEFARELQALIPGVALRVSRRSRKSAYIYVSAPDSYDEGRVWDILDSLAAKQLNTLLTTGYSIHLLLDPARPHAALTPAILREKWPDWDDAKPPPP